MTSLRVPKLYKPSPFIGTKTTPNLKFQHTKVGQFRFDEAVWLIYTLKGCPHCETAKTTLRDKGLLKNENQVRDCDQYADELKALMDKPNVNDLKPRAGFTTFPRVFNDKGEFIGGNSDLQKYFK